MLIFDQFSIIQVPHFKPVTGQVIFIGYSVQQSGSSMYFIIEVVLFYSVLMRYASCETAIDYDFLSYVQNANSVLTLGSANKGPSKRKVVRFLKQWTQTLLQVYYRLFQHFLTFLLYKISQKPASNSTTFEFLNLPPKPDQTAK